MLKYICIITYLWYDILTVKQLAVLLKQNGEIKMSKIKLIKDTHCEDSFSLTEMDYIFAGGFVNIYKDLNEFMATLYEGSYCCHKVWGKTPKEAANKLLSNYDLKIGMEVS